MNNQVEERVKSLREMGATVIGTFKTEGGETVVLIVCTACGLARSPDHRCPYCELKALRREREEMRAALDQVSAGASALGLLLNG